MVEAKKSCTLLGGAVLGFESNKDAKKKTTYAKECAGGKTISIVFFSDYQKA